ncbi:polymorphic toxin-type HINT domain-containing protein [Dactylosporangium sp. NPDC049525]|uniref:polymorphic toxin-type HINT domain-containing protein n=1 Tax=Dactylosporangium sp. NPDC049525 TaxID=3154730 RepID=UPI003437F67C
MTKAPTSFAPPKDTSTPFHATATAWPAVATADVAMTVPAGGAKQVQAVQAGALPVTVAPVVASDGTYAGPRQVQVRVHDQHAAGAAGVNGVLLSLTPQQNGRGDVRVSLDYTSFAQAYGGNYGSRLRLVQLPACALTSPQLAECRAATPLRSSNEPTAKRLAATVTLTGTSATPMSPSLMSASAAEGMQPMVLAASASSDPGQEGGAAGNYAATGLKPSGSWTAGSSTGAFTYSNPIVVPPAVSKLVPSLALSYNSSAVDGQTSATGAQSSWVGDGWSTPDSYIEQTFVSCADKPEGSPPPVVTSDTCYAGPILTMSLGGSSSSLIWDAAKSVWKPQDDNGEVITQVTNSNNGTGTYNTDYWTVTTRDGTQYSFGRNHLPGWVSGKAATNSVDYEPVYSAHPKDATHLDPCYNATYSLSVCTMAYKWHLDYVVDVHGNAMSYFYKQDTNYYGRYNGTTNTVYVRDSYLDHIDYGFTDGNAYATPPNMVIFNPGPRCLSGSCALTTANAVNWPDVPVDLICASGSSCAARSPSMFSTLRLTSIVTQQYVAASTQYKPVDTYALSQTLPAPHDLTSPALWLSSVTRTGSAPNASPSTAITLPAVTFTPTQSMPNRVSSADFPELDRFRISSVTTETGAVITASYTLVNPCTAPVTIDPATNTSSCYPVYWTPQGYADPYRDWFNKYVVDKVTVTDPTGGAPATTTSYQFSGGAGWHYDDNEVVQQKYRTYGQFRGYGSVKTFVGDLTNDPRTQTENTYYRGMSNNNNTTAVTLTDSAGGQHDDANALAGNVLETTSYLGENGGVDSSTITSYWISAATATRSRTGLQPLTANWVAPVETFTRQALTSTGSTVWRYTEEDTTYDATITDANFGLPTASYSHTVPADAAYDNCTTTTYAAANTTKNLVGLTARVETDSVACNHFTQGTPASVPASVNALTAPASVSRPAQVVSDTQTFFDDQTNYTTTFPQAGVPTKGDVTMVRQAIDATNYQTRARGAFDNYGRPLTAWDANDNKTTTTYTMSAGLMVGSTTTNALNQAVTSTFDPARGATLTVTDPNAVVTTQTFDALGRASAVWTNSRSTSLPANYTFSYVVSNTGTTAATTNQLLEGGGSGYLPSVVIYDAQLRTRQTQTSAAFGTGRVITDTFYDSRGWTRATYNNWWDPANIPGTAIASATDLNVMVTDQDQYTYDGLGRVVVGTKLNKGVVVSSTTTVRNGDQTTVIPPTGGVVQRTITDKAGRNVEIDQYAAAPTLHTPANPFTGIWTVTGGTTNAVTYGYDNRNHQNSTKDAAGNTWTSTFNLLGQRVSSTDPDAGSQSMAYDKNSNLTQITDGRTKTISYTYDALNRKTFQYNAPSAGQTAANKTAAWYYDNSNSVAGVTHAIGKLTTSIGYVNGVAYITSQEKDFNVFGESTGLTVSVSSSEGVLGGDYVYGHVYTTNLGLPLKDIYPGRNGLPAETVLHTYTAGGLPNGLGGLTGYAVSTTYDAWGRPTQGVLGASPNLSYLTNTYDEHSGRITNQLISRQAGTPANIDNEAYTYDLAGNLTRQASTRLGASTPTETQCFTYDNLDRLTNAWTATDNCATTPTPTDRSMVGDSLGTSSSYWTAWTVDTIGRRAHQTQYGAVAAGDIDTDYTYVASQPHTLRGTTTTGATTGSTSYGYDLAGNTVARNAAQGNQTLIWNDAGKLTDVTGGTAGASKYVYGPDGDLLLQKDPGSTVLYLPGQQLTLDTATGIVSGTRYYALPGGGTAVRTGTTSTAVTFQFSDMHGTPTVYLNYTAQTPSWRQSTPYGGPRGTAAAAPDNHGFLNRPTDVSTGLIAVGARHYDPVIGSFVSVDEALDTSDPQQLGGYAYASNNPITHSDPTGLWTDHAAEDSPAYHPNCNDNPKHKSCYVGWYTATTVTGCGKSVSCKPKAKTHICLVGFPCSADNKSPLHNPAGGLCCHPAASTIDCSADKLACAIDAGMQFLVLFEVVIFVPIDIALLIAPPAEAAADYAEVAVIAGEEEAAAAARARARAAAAARASRCSSFTPDTPVLMADGTSKPIVEIAVGDVVAAGEPSTGEHPSRSVTQLHENRDTDLADLTVLDSGGVVAVVHTTQNHPFWSDTRHDWVDAGELQPGEALLTDDDAAELVVAVANFTGTATMYNLTVDISHTYYVLAGSAFVLVHNAPIGKCPVDPTIDHGMLAKMQMIDDKLAEGYVDIIEEVSFVTIDGTPFRADFVARKPGGRWEAFESKGNAGKYTDNQEIGYPQLDYFGAEIRTDKVPGLKPGDFIQMDVTSERRWCPVCRP